MHSEAGLLGHMCVLIPYSEEPPNCSVAARPSYVATQGPWVAASPCCFPCDGGCPDRWCELGLNCGSVGISQQSVVRSILSRAFWPLRSFLRRNVCFLSFCRCLFTTLLCLLQSLTRCHHFFLLTRLLASCLRNCQQINIINFFSALCSFNY